ncbi:alternative oxidase-domain-containing protein [Scleroderma yunnanense]
MSTILKTTVIRSIRRSYPLLLRSTLAEASLRTSPKQHFAPFVHCAQIHSGRVSQDSLSKSNKDEETIGSEGLHREDLAGSKKGLAVDSEKAGTATTVHGDWVLFHPVYTPEELRAVLHRQPKSLSDKVALALVRLLRWGFDLVSGYKHKPLPPDGNNMSLEELRRGGYVLTEKAWLRRLLFLETVAGVPGMVAAMLRHLDSLRSMRRDHGWIHTLLEDAENERMHLMTFMTLKQPSIWFRAMVLGAQGVFSNIFFFSYLISPKTCHRFVGHLEEEAVLTYTRCIEEIEAGRLPEWKDMPAPKIAKDYWRLPDDAKLLDVIYAVRSDESTHRFINHSLANLNPKTDVNPFALREPDMHIKGKKLGFERSEAEQYVSDSYKLIHQSQTGEPTKK